LFDVEVDDCVGGRLTVPEVDVEDATPLEEVDEIRPEVDVETLTVPDVDDVEEDEDVEVDLEDEEDVDDTFAPDVEEVDPDAEEIVMFKLIEGMIDPSRLS